MVALKRFLVALSLAAYFVATTAIHALHDHSGADHCCHELHGLCRTAGESEGAHAATGHEDINRGGSPIHPADCEDTCFACRFLAAKSIAPVVVAVIEHIEVIRPLDPPQWTFTPLVRPDLPLSRGPPTA
jgi:hypothetical protein